MKTKQLQLAGLTAIITLTWGYVILNYIDPPKSYLGHEDKIAMAMLLDAACPFLKEQYAALEVDGNIEFEGAADIVKQCRTRLQAASFEEALINEFGRHYHE